MVEYGKRTAEQPEPGSRSQPIVIIGGESRLKVATGSRKAGELYRGVKLFPPRIWRFGGFGWSSPTGKFNDSMKTGVQSRVNG
jgi:hypothetical protein